MPEKLNRNLVVKTLGIKCMRENCHESSSYLFYSEFPREEYILDVFRSNPKLKKSDPEFIALDYIPEEFPICLCHKHFHEFRNKSKVPCIISCKEKFISKIELIWSQGWGIKIKSNFLLKLKPGKIYAGKINLDYRIKIEQARLLGKHIAEYLTRFSIEASLEKSNKETIKIAEENLEKL